MRFLLTIHLEIDADTPQQADDIGAATCSLAEGGRSRLMGWRLARALVQRFDPPFPRNDDAERAAVEARAAAIGYPHSEAR